MILKRPESRSRLSPSVSKMAAVTLWLSMFLALDVSGSALYTAVVPPPENFFAEHIPQTNSQRTIRRLVGGHMKIKANDFDDSSKNAIGVEDKRKLWDDGMLMSSAGDGEQKKRNKEDDDEKKTLSDQVAEGKYGLIQNELFEKMPSRPGVLSYETVPETQKVDNLHTLGGLKKDEIWLAEDQLLVLKGGSYPDKTVPEVQDRWPPIDSYEAPRRQVKLPQKPNVPPPFPVRLSDDGPLVFLTPNGSVPAAAVPGRPSFQGPAPDGTSSAETSPFRPEGVYPGDFTPGTAPFPNAPFPVLNPGNASGPFGFQTPINGSITDGLPPSKLSDPYDEDDPSNYYPPPYNFSYTVDNASAISAGPLVPGIVLPPPPDFFAPLEENTTDAITTTKSSHTVEPKKRPQIVEIKQRRPHKFRANIQSNGNTAKRPIAVNDVTYDTPNIVYIPKQRTNKVQSELPTQKPTEKQTTHKAKHKQISKSPAYPITLVYDYQEPKNPSTTSKPYIIFDVPNKQSSLYDKSYVTTTPVPLREYYTSKPVIEIQKQKLEQVYNKPIDNSLASFYFYEETPKSTQPPFYIGNYYDAAPARIPHKQIYNQNTQTGFTPSIDVSFRPSDSIFLWPQKQGPRTLTQEYFSIQNPKGPQGYHSIKPDFYQQISDIQQTIDYFSGNKGKQYHKHSYKPKIVTPKPVYQFSFQTDRRPINFRAPKPDNEPFIPMVSYSKPYSYESVNSVTPTAQPAHQQYLVENVRVTTETPTSTEYYPAKSNGNSDYDDTPTEKKKVANPVVTSTKSPRKIIQQQYTVTPNPLDHAYFTKQDERYFDDITRNYFSIFGKKIEGEGDKATTTPSTPIDISPVRTPLDNSINIQYDDDNYRRQNPPSLADDTIVNYQNPPATEDPYLVEYNPPSLAGDTDVNYKDPRPEINPDSEFVPIANPVYQNHRIQPLIHIDQPVRQHYDDRRKHQYVGEQADLLAPPRNPSLADDTRVNYQRPLPPLEPEAELVGEGRPGTFVSYRLPGDGAHVYFVTPRRTRDRRPR